MELDTPLSIAQAIAFRKVDLVTGAEAILECIMAERERCAGLAEFGPPEEGWHPQSLYGQVGAKIAALMRDKGPGQSQ